MLPHLPRHTQRFEPTKPPHTHTPNNTSLSLSLSSHCPNQVSLRSISSIDSRDSLSSILTPLPLDTLAGLTEQLHLIRMADLLGGADDDSNSNSTADGVPGSKLVNGVSGEKEKETRARWRSPKTLKAFLVEVIISQLERRVRSHHQPHPLMCADGTHSSLFVCLPVYVCLCQPDQLSQIRSMPLYPTQEVLWDPNLVPAEHYQGEFSLALPKLNLQFLTIHDYLLRNFKLFRSGGRSAASDTCGGIIIIIACVQARVDV